MACQFEVEEAETIDNTIGNDMDHERAKHDHPSPATIRTDGIRFRFTSVTSRNRHCFDIDSLRSFPILVMLKRIDNWFWFERSFVRKELNLLRESENGIFY